MAKAQADVQALASALERHHAHTGMLPGALEALTSRTTNRRGEVAGPFLSRIPASPAGWTPYVYLPTPQATFTITTESAHDGMSLRHGPDGFHSRSYAGVPTAGELAVPAALVAIIGVALAGPWIFAAMTRGDRRGFLRQAAGLHLGLGVILVLVPTACVHEATRTLWEVTSAGSVLLVLTGFLETVYLVGSWLSRAST